MNQADNDDIAASLRGKKGADFRSTERVEIIHRSAQLAWVVGSICTAIAGAIIAVTIWVGRVDRRMSDAERRLAEFDTIKTERIGQISSLQKYDSQNERVMDAVNALIKANRKELDTAIARLDKIEPIVDYMESLRRFGISNKEDYIRQHGVAAPSNPAAEPSKEKH